MSRGWIADCPHIAGEETEATDMERLPSGSRLRCRPGGAGSGVPTVNHSRPVVTAWSRPHGLTVCERQSRGDVAFDKPLPLMHGRHGRP